MACHYIDTDYLSKPLPAIQQSVCMFVLMWDLQPVLLSIVLNLTSSMV